MLSSKQKLAVFLSKLRVFEVPVLSLEQYPTDGEIAATILWDAHMQGEIEGKAVADFGCGTGILGIGALALGAQHVTFIEIDPTIFPILMENLHFLEQELGEEYGNYEIIHGRIENYSTPVDLVLQNPPFGTQEKHADMIFVKQAISLAPVVYSLHKTSTEEYLKSWAQQNSARITTIARFKFPLKRTMPQHEKKMQHIEVSCLKFLS
jgi:putative methylase